MSKRQPDSSESHQASKKRKSIPVFRSAVPRVRSDTPTANEPSSSRSTARSTVTTLSQGEDGRRRASGTYRNRQQRASTLMGDPNIEAGGIPDPSEAIATNTPEPDGIQDTTETSKTKRKRNNNAAVSHLFSCLAFFLTYFACQSHLQKWLTLRQVFLDELLRHDGRGDFLNQSTCFVCEKKDSLYKCEDCTHCALLKCQSCTISAHRSQPFHRIKVIF
jgi:hypothetical protein